MRPAAGLTPLLCLVLAGWGGSGGEASPSDTAPGDGKTLEELWRAPGEDVSGHPGTSDHEPGDVRVSFVVLDAEGRPVTLPTAHVWLARSLDRPPFLESTAKL